MISSKFNYHNSVHYSILTLVIYPKHSYVHSNPFRDRPPRLSMEKWTTYRNRLPSWSSSRVPSQSLLCTETSHTTSSAEQLHSSIHQWVRCTWRMEVGVLETYMMEFHTITGGILEHRVVELQNRNQLDGLF